MADFIWERKRVGRNQDIWTRAFRSHWDNRKNKLAKMSQKSLLVVVVICSTIISFLWSTGKCSWYCHIVVDCSPRMCSRPVAIYFIIDSLLSKEECASSCGLTGFMDISLFFCYVVCDVWCSWWFHPFCLFASLRGWRPLSRHQTGSLSAAFWPRAIYVASLVRESAPSSNDGAHTHLSRRIIWRGRRRRS